MLRNYLPILVFVLLALFTVLVIPALSAVLGRRRRDDAGVSPYECGVTDVKTDPQRISVRFYILAMLFIVFDLEVAFLYPWTTVFRKLGFFGFWEMVIFIGVLFAGLIYAWRVKALEWE